MRFLSTATLCLISTACFAQAPLINGPSPTAPGPVRNLPPVQGNSITESSTIRAFNAGADGRVRSIYLRSGSVVDLGLGFYPRLDSFVHKGARVRVGGTRLTQNGQTIISPQVLTIDRQNFIAQVAEGPVGALGAGAKLDGPGGPPPPPEGGPRPGPRRDISAAGGPPPPPPAAGGPVRADVQGDPGSAPPAPPPPPAAMDLKPAPRIDGPPLSGLQPLPPRREGDLAPLPVAPPQS